MNNIEEIATSFAREYGNDAIYPSHLFKAILHKDIGMVHFIETDLDKDYYYLQEWADVQMQLSPKKIDIFLLTQRSLYLVYESFNHGKHRFAVDASSGRYFLYDFRFSHFL